MGTTFLLAALREVPEGGAGPGVVVVALVALLGAPGVCVFVVGREVRVFEWRSRLRRDVVCRRRSIFEKRGKAEEQERRRLKKERGATPFWSLFPASLYARDARWASHRPRESRNAAGEREEEPARNRNEREASNFVARHRHHQPRRRCCSLSLSLLSLLTRTNAALSLFPSPHNDDDDAPACWRATRRGRRRKRKRREKRKHRIQVESETSSFCNSSVLRPLLGLLLLLTLFSLFFPLSFLLIKWEPRRRAAPS